MYAILVYIHEHLTDKITCAEVAARFGYSMWHFCSLFRQFTGRSFVSYVRYYRMQYALSDILDGVSVTKCAMRYGYDTVSGFNKAFLSEFGCSPREIKQTGKDKYLEYQRRRLTMSQLTDRCVLLRDEAMNLRTYNHIIQPQFSIWRDIAYRELKSPADYETAVSHTIKLLAENFPTVIRDWELLVGDNFGVREVVDIDIKNESALIDAGLDESQREHIASVSQNPIPSFPYVSVPYTEKETQLNREWAAIGRCIDGNHSVLGYEKVLRLGFEGIAAEVAGQAAAHPESSVLYDACLEICEAGKIIGERYAEKAEKLAESGSFTAGRRAELERIAEVCRRVPRYPASNFYEAVQSLWFAHIFNTWEDTINANSLGRLDQLLYPYYRADVDSGKITDDEAFELICSLWIKLYRDYDVQQSCVGGCKPDGSDAVNRLSWLMLDATEQLDFIRCMSVRFSPSTDRSFVKRALEVVGHVGKGVPFFFNDSVMIEALTGAGISLEDARDYTEIGCVETVIPGKSNPHAVTGETNFLKGLEYALENGRSMINPQTSPGIESGAPSGFDSYDKLKAAVFAQIRNILDVTCKKVSEHTAASMVNSPHPYKSLLTEGCLESGRDFNRHGAKYDYYQVMFGGIPNLADSLEVLRKFVYEDKKYTLAYIIDQLEKDFPDEKLRCEFVNRAPKYGNDIDEVDEIAVEITNFGCDVLEEMSEKYGLKFHAQPFTFLWMVDHGRNTAATPDGRRKGEIIAYSVSPMQGRDFSGFIALMNSISRLPTKRTPGTTSAIVELDPKLFCDRNLDRFAEILLSSAANGLSNVQFNTVSLDTLKDAKLHPEKYSNLAVRVSGFSQKFNLLDPALQDHIIERTKHQCL